MTSGESPRAAQQRLGAESAPGHGATENRAPDRAADDVLGGSAGAAPTRWDRVRWGPVWAGTLVVVTIYLVLQLLFFALGWLDLGFEGTDAGAAAGIVSGVLALIAFFLGALAAGACALWRGAADGVVNGLMVWALSVVGILALAVFGGTAMLGPLSQFATQMSDVQQQVTQVDPQQALAAARETAGWAVLGLGLAAAAAALGGMAGAKLWPRRRTDVH